jgi:hypothetical protein
MTIEREYSSAYNDFFEMFPEAKTALETGKEWEYAPDSAADSSAWHTYCDNCADWHTDYYPQGFSVSDGKVWFDILHCDQDGNWDTADSAEIGTPEAAALEKEYGYDAWCKNYLDYCKHVAETGKDPCGEFLVSPTVKVKQTWRATFNPSVLGVVLVAARKHGQDWHRPEDLKPTAEGNSVLGFLNAQHRGRGVWVTEDFKTLEELEQCITNNSDLKRVRSSKGAVTVEFSITVEKPNRGYRAQLVKLAKRTLHDDTNPPIDDAAENPRWESI